MAVKSVDEGLDRGLVEVTQVRCGLTRFLAEHEGLRIDETEGVNDDLALD